MRHIRVIGLVMAALLAFGSQTGPRSAEPTRPACLFTVGLAGGLPGAACPPEYDSGGDTL